MRWLIPRWVFSHLPAFPCWIVPVLLIFIGSVTNRLLAQTPPTPAASNAPAAPKPPDAANSPPATAANTKPPPTAAELQGAAIAQQRAAIRKQAENLGLWLMPLDGKPPAETAEPPGCDPLGDNLVNPLIEDAAKQQSLDPKLLRAMIGQESAFRPCAVSAKGAQGLMQLMPETAAELGVADRSIPSRILMAAPATSSSSSKSTRAICRRPWAPITPDQRKLTNPAACRIFRKPASMWTRFSPRPA